jgi:hypothetical protein
MNLDRLLVLATDAAYFEYAWIALSSFLRHNAGWSALVMDVGLTPSQADILGRLATVVRYPREETGGVGPPIPSALSQCMALAELPGPDHLLLYLDSDTITLGKVDALVEEFLASGRPIGVAIESVAGTPGAMARHSWADSRVPDEFPQRDRWQDLPHFNTGVILATGNRAAAIGDRCLNLYNRLNGRFRLGGRALIESILYEDQVPIFPIPLRYHCSGPEEQLTISGRPYVNPVSVNGEPVILRHFCGSKNKQTLDQLKSSLFTLYPLPPGVENPSQPSPRSRCAVLVPVGGAIEPQCEHGLHELERRGYRVRRAFGYSAIDFGRSSLASQAIADGFEEIMWIDSDVGFDPDDVDKLRSHNLPLCCGLYAKKNGQGFACNFLPGTDLVVFGKGGGLRELLFCGFGFVYTRREVYESIKQRSHLPDCNQRFGPPITPWFFPELAPDGAGWWYLAEDYAFCHRARQCGFKVMADTTIRLTHVGRHPYTWEDIMARQSRYATLELRLEGNSLGQISTTTKSAREVGPYGPVSGADNSPLLPADPPAKDGTVATV